MHTTANKVLRLVFIILFLFIFSHKVFSQSFEQNLKKIACLYDSKKFAELYNTVHPTKAKDNLKDVRLYMEAEALKNTNRKAESIKSYAELIKKYPDSEAAIPARMSYFVLSLENVQPNNLGVLEKTASSLQSVWQKGTAFYKLSDLTFLDIKQRSKYAYRSLYEFNKDRMFYQTAQASVELLKKIITNPDKYAFSKAEWLAIASWIINEKLTGEIYKSKASQKLLETAFGEPVSTILKAVNLNETKKIEKSIELFNSVINNKKNPAPMLSWARMLRGNIYHILSRHSEAIIDYQDAMKNNVFPVDIMAVKYRLMRSLFECGRDLEAIEYLKQFIKQGFGGNLLPVHIYEMGLKHYDNNKYQLAVPYFMILARNFPGHYRADDALGYSAICAGLTTKDGQSIIELLKKKYPNSFFVWWLSPNSRTKPLKFKEKPVKKLSAATIQRLDAMDKLWGTKLSFLAKSEAIKLTDKNKSNLALFKGIIDIAKKHNDYHQVVTYAERLSNQISGADKTLSDNMPNWGWQALYPMAYWKDIKKYSSKFEVDPYWVLSIMREESHFKEDTLSRSNAISLMQILPTTGKWIADKLGERKYKKDSLWEPDVNIRYGTWYLKYLSDLFNGDKFLASAAYNGGQGNIQRKVEAGPHGKLPVLERLDKVPLPETRDYYKKVMGNHWNYTRLWK